MPQDVLRRRPEKSVMRPAPQSRRSSLDGERIGTVIRRENEGQGLRYM
jgi:hypothetical protein